MKITKVQEDQLRELAFAGTPNKAIAATMDIPLTEVHAHRSRLGITRDKVAAATGKSVDTAAQQMMVEPTFEAAAAQMDKAAETKNCRNCAHVICYARGRDCPADGCRHFITEEDHCRRYLLIRKNEFLDSLVRTTTPVVTSKQVTEIQAFLDKYIPDDWRGDNG